MQFIHKTFKRNTLQPRASLAVMFFILLFAAGVQAQHSITVDGNASDWIGTPSSTIHGTVVSQGEFIYTGNSGDARTDPGTFSSNNDITEIRLGQDGSTLYFLIKMADIDNVAAPHVSILINTGSGTGGNNLNFLGDQSGVSFSNANFTGRQRVIDLHFVHDNGLAPLNINTFLAEFFDGGSWFNVGTNQVAISAANNVIEFSIALSDLDLNSSSTVKFAVCTFGNNTSSNQGSDFNNDIDATNNLFLADFVDYMSPGGGTGNAYAGRDNGTLGMGNNNTDNQLGYFAQIALSDASLPVSLSSFTAEAGDGQVTLRWATESEVQNEAFILERGLDEANFTQIAEIPGQGSSNYRQEYSFTDAAVQNGVTYYYRLADRDYGGVITYHNTVTATPNSAGSHLNRIDLAAGSFRLHPNFPNPFNPETNIRFEVPVNSTRPEIIRLEVYNAAGQRMRTLYNGQLAGGVYEMTWDGRNGQDEALPSGTYFLHLRSNRATQSQKMILLR